MKHQYIFPGISALAILVFLSTSVSASSYLNNEDPQHPASGDTGIMVLGEYKPPKYGGPTCGCAENIRDSDNEHGGFIRGLTDCSGLVSGKAQRVNVQSTLNVVLIQITIGGQLFQNTNHGLKNSEMYRFTSAKNPYNSFTLTTGHNAETTLESLDRDAHIKKKLEATLGIGTSAVATFWPASIDPAEKTNGFTPMKDIHKDGHAFPGLYAFWYDPKKKLFYLSEADTDFTVRNVEGYGPQTLIFHNQVRITLDKDFNRDNPIHQVVFRVK